MDLGVGAKRPPHGGGPGAAFAEQRHMGWKSDVRTFQTFVEVASGPVRAFAVKLPLAMKPQHCFAQLRS